MATAQPKTNVIRTGIDGLDDVLAGGLPRNRIYLVDGDPGVGKTTLALQVLLTGAAHGERGLYITLSETREEIEAVAQSHGWSLDGLTIVELSAVEQWQGMDAENTLFAPSDVELQETTRALLDRVEATQPTVVVFDSLSELRLLAQSALRYRRQILAFKQYFAGKQCTVLLLDDRTSQTNDLQLESLAHGVIRMEQVPTSYGEERRRLRIVKMRGLKFRGGYHDFTIRQGGLVVFPRLVAAEHHTPFVREPLPSGIEAIDRLLGGGIDRGTSTLISGPAGAGKSALMSQYVSAAAARGETSVIFAFDEGRGTLLERSRALGIPLAEQIEAGLVFVKQVDPAELTPGEFAHAARDFVERHHARIVVIDSLNGYLNAMPEEKMLTIQMHELLSYFGQKGVTTILVMAQHGLMGRMESPVDVSYLSDSIILLRYFEAEGRIRKAISVVKKRSGAHEDTIREYTLGQNGVTVGQPLTAFRGVLTGVPEFVGLKRDLGGGGGGGGGGGKLT